MPTDAEVRKSISKPLSRNVVLRDRQKLKRRNLIKEKIKNRKAQVLQPKKAKVKQTDTSAVGLAQKLRKRFK